jgi:hypothetical protein
MRRLIAFAVFALAGPSLTTAPVLAQTYTYTARTAAPAQQTGQVTAGSITWSCEDRACTVSGPWPQPGVGACAQLAAIVGRISEYGHPGARLNGAQLEQCNASAARPALQTTLAPGIAAQIPSAVTPQVRAPEIQAQQQAGQRVSPQQIQRPQPQQRPGVQTPELQVQIPPRVTARTEMFYEAPRITSRTVTVEPPPTERLYAIRSGGGDGDFGGNGPRVQVTTTVSAEDDCLFADIHMMAEETRPDHTRGSVRERVRLWCNPEGGHIERIVSPTRATGEYTDTDWEIDTIVPGRGEIDVRRGLPAVDGPVRSFIIMGDTNGDVFNNDNDGRDVGDLDADGNRTVSRTSVQVQWNEISVVVPIVEDPEVSGPAGTTTIWVRGQHSDFLTLRHTGGDRDFYGNGPRMEVSSQLSLSPDGTRILASIGGTAEEVRGDTRASGRSDNQTIWTAPPGWRIDNVEVEYRWWDEAGDWQQQYESALNRRADVSFTDRDHEQDFLVDGRGEGGRDGIWFDADTEDARRRAMSHVAAFRVIGDTNGDEAGTRTGVQAFYQPLLVTLTPIDPARARASDLDPDVFLDVPTGDYGNRLSGGNSCGPQAASRVLRFYGVPTTYEQFKRRVQSSGNFVSDQSLGTPPGTLRDRMNDLSSGFVHDVLPLGGANNDRALARIRELLDQGRPVITLVGWGSQYAADIISPHDAAATAHWIVVRGYNSRNRTFLIVDNGHAVEWSYEHFASMFDYGQDAQFEALLAMMNVEKGSIIYRR